MLSQVSFRHRAARLHAKQMPSLPDQARLDHVVQHWLGRLDAFRLFAKARDVTQPATRLVRWTTRFVYVQYEIRDPK